MNGISHWPIKGIRSRIGIASRRTCYLSRGDYAGRRRISTCLEPESASFPDERAEVARNLALLSTDAGASSELADVIICWSAFILIVHLNTYETERIVLSSYGRASTWSDAVEGTLLTFHVSFHTGFSVSTCTVDLHRHECGTFLERNVFILTYT